MEVSTTHSVQVQHVVEMSTSCTMGGLTESARPHIEQLRELGVTASLCDQILTEIEELDRERGGLELDEVDTLQFEVGTGPTLTTGDERKRDGEPSPSTSRENSNPETCSMAVSGDGASSSSSPSESGRIGRALDSYFKITERGSTIWTEVRGGTVGFLTLAYIVLLNPQVLAHGGVPFEYAACATCLASTLATLICGIWGNIPVGCAPGLGLSAYLVYGMIPQIEGSPSEQYLGGMMACFVTGLVVFALTMPGFINCIVDSLPNFIKIATIVGMGLFLAFIGMIEVGLVEATGSEHGAPLELGDMSSWIIWLALINCLLIATSSYFKFNGALLLCILLISILYFTISGEWPVDIMQMPQFQDPLLVLDLKILRLLPWGLAVEAVISFVLIMLFDVCGVTFAIAKLCGLSDDANTMATFQKTAFIGTSIGTMMAALFGCTPIIVSIETASAVAAGARTGLSAVVIAVYFIIAMFFGPVLGAVPSAATSPILIFIGTLMMGEVGQIAWDNMRIAIPAFFCIAMMPFTYSIANGLFFGVSMFILCWIATGQFMSKWSLCGLKKRNFDAELGYSNVIDFRGVHTQTEADYDTVSREEH